MLLVPVLPVDHRVGGAPLPALAAAVMVVVLMAVQMAQVWGGAQGGSASYSPENGEDAIAEEVVVIGEKIKEKFGEEVGEKLTEFLRKVGDSRPEVIRFLMDRDLEFEVLPDNAQTKFGQSESLSVDQETGIAVSDSKIIIRLNPADISTKISSDLKYSDQWEITLVHEIGHAYLGNAGSHDVPGGSDRLTGFIKDIGYATGYIDSDYEANAWNGYNF